MWQAIYEELRGAGLEIIAVAFDAAGTAAVEAKIRCPDIAERPTMIADLMGWSPELWAQQAPPTYPCLIDETHLVAELYGMVNVPQGVWIDEQGRIVRPAESAGTIDMVRHLNRETLELPDAAVKAGASARMAYIDALRDWVKNGEKSPYALPPEEVKRRMKGPGEAEVLAATHAKLGRHLFAQGDNAGGRRHFAEASRLCPDSWNYRRQSMVLEPELIGQLNTAPEFWAAVDALGDTPYYPPADLSPVR
ncbi:MAG: hypothetical protein H6977_09760 [Gammaproteobacteria bacterium]|nr:hypothetical protein [Gammaproteobacteria bacterium]